LKDYSHIKMDLNYTLGRTALKEGIPWITIESFHHLLEIIKPEFRVFEWGSGGSTVFWARECASVISIEHNSEWIPRVQKMLDDRGLEADLRYKRGLPKEEKDRFKPYANMILKEPDNSFDLIYVDGEASSRGWCLNNAMLKLKPGGWIVLDNSQWIKRELPDFDKFEYIERDLEWPGAKNFDWWTTLYHQKG